MLIKVSFSRRVPSWWLSPRGPHENPITGGEDFASVLKEMPGAFVFMGACPPDRDHSKAETNHSNKAVFDDSKLSDGSALLAALAFDTLDEAAAN